jgi:hypothetical protein
MLAAAIKEVEHILADQTAFLVDNRWQRAGGYRARRIQEMPQAMEIEAVATNPKAAAARKTANEMSHGPGADARAPAATVPPLPKISASHSPGRTRCGRVARRLFFVLASRDGGDSATRDQPLRPGTTLRRSSGMARSNFGRTNTSAISVSTAAESANKSTSSARSSARSGTLSTLSAAPTRAEASKTINRWRSTRKPATSPSRG